MVSARLDWSGFTVDLFFVIIYYSFLFRRCFKIQLFYFNGLSLVQAARDADAGERKDARHHREMS